MNECCKKTVEELLEYLATWGGLIYDNEYRPYSLEWKIANRTEEQVLASLGEELRKCFLGEGA